MNTTFKNLPILGLCVLLANCAPVKEIPMTPTISIPVQSCPVLEVIGGVELVHFLPMKSPIKARIDTGAETSSIGVKNQRYFERDGEKWVSFYISDTKFEKRIIRRVSITRAGKDESRAVVMMNIRIGQELLQSEFTLANREKFEYQALIGRNIINGNFIIDPSIEKTLI